MEMEGGEGAQGKQIKDPVLSRLRRFELLRQRLHPWRGVTPEHLLRPDPSIRTFVRRVVVIVCVYVCVFVFTFVFIYVRVYVFIVYVCVLCLPFACVVLDLAVH